MGHNRFNADKRKEKGKKVVTPKQNQDIPTGQQKPIFSLQYLHQDYCLSRCEAKEKSAFADAIYKLSQLTWQQIDCQPRHGLGYEKIERNSIRTNIPSCVTEDVRLIAFRFCAKAPMVGYRHGATFHIIWFDREFTLYDHGS